MIVNIDVGNLCLFYQIQFQSIDVISHEASQRKSKQRKRVVYRIRHRNKSEFIMTQHRQPERKNHENSELEKKEFRRMELFNHDNKNRY